MDLMCSSEPDQSNTSCAEPRMQTVSIDLIEIIQSHVRQSLEGESHTGVIKQLTDKIRQLKEQREMILQQAQFHNKFHYLKFITERYLDTVDTT